MSLGYAGGFAALPMDARPLAEPIRSTIMDGVDNWPGYVVVLCLGALAIVAVLAAYGVL